MCTNLCICALCFGTGCVPVFQTEYFLPINYLKKILESIYRSSRFVLLPFFYEVEHYLF